VCQVLVLLACCASFDVLRDPCSGTRPEVLSIDASDHFISSGVTIDGAFMPYIYEFTFQPLIQWYDESVSFDVSPEQFIRVVYALNWVDTCPFFH
jgi:hypothetical protein